MLIHKECGGKILIPIDGLRIAVESFGINTKDKNLVLNQITLIDEREGRRTIDITFTCLKCHTIEIPEEDIEISCNNCGDLFKLDEIFIYAGSGGFYCEKCKKKISGRDSHITEEGFINVLPYFKRKLQL
jgi:hypothetical protein